MMNDTELRFCSMGTDVRVLVGPRRTADAARPAAAAEQARDLILSFDRSLSRFDPLSELSALNRDPGRVVPACELVRLTVRSGIAAAEATCGLVDPTLVDEIEAIGYERTRAGAEPASLEEALAMPRELRPARPGHRARWRSLSVDDRAKTVERPPGVRFDSGGVGKGLAADLAAGGLRDYRRFAVDCGGDVRIGGAGAALEPFEVEVRHPLRAEPAHRLLVSAGGIASSGIDRRIWRHGGEYVHHLLDPSTGRPAWTGVIAATAIAPTAVEAETLSKAALLAGPTVGRRILASRGGVLVLDDGEVEVIGAAAGPIGPQVVFPDREIEVAA